MQVAIPRIPPCLVAILEDATAAVEMEGSNFHGSKLELEEIISEVAGNAEFADACASFVGEVVG